MSVERGPLRPISLADSEADLAALRAGTAAPRSLIHVAHAAEHALRRMLRDDPTASVELRLQALAPEELSLDGLLAELRRHDRIPVELAAGIHELSAAAARVEHGAPVEPRDAANAVAVAETLEAQLRKRPAVATLEDPLFAAEPDPLTDEPAVTAHPVPAAGGPSRWPWLPTLVGLVAVLALAAWVATRRGGDRELRRADALVEDGRTATAEASLKEIVARRANDARASVRLARIYREAGRPAEALLALRNGLAAAPGDPRLNEELGAQLLEQRRPADAVRAYATALRADSASERAWVGLVRAMRESGNPAGAEGVLARAPEAARALAGPTPPTTSTAPPPVLP